MHRSGLDVSRVTLVKVLVEVHMRPISVDNCINFRTINIAFTVQHILVC